MNNFILLYFILIIVSKRRYEDGVYDQIWVKNIDIKSNVITKTKNKNVQVIVHCDEYEKKQYDIEKFGKVIYQLPMINSYVIDIDKDKVKYIESNNETWKVEIDAHITAQMNQARSLIGVNVAHSRGIKGKGIGVAIVDTGISLHPDFVEESNRLVAFQDFINDHEEPYDDNGHGTQGYGKKTQI